MRAFACRFAGALAFALACSTAVHAIELCAGRDRFTCVVDGDTIWLEGTKYRLQNFDTPEPQTNICGGAAETALAQRASARLVELLNTNAWQLVPAGEVGGYGRDLATIYIGGRDVGDILIEEGLARRWPDGEEFWCR